MGGKNSREESYFQQHPSCRMSSGTSEQHYPSQSNYGGTPQPNHGYAPQQLAYQPPQTAYAYPPAAQSQPPQPAYAYLPVAQSQPGNRKLDRRYSRIADNYNSLDEVTEALARAGLESSNLILGIDFTKSNEWTGKISFNRRSLHHIGDVKNPYEQAISIIGRTLSAFDEDNLIPCFGFGDALTHDQDVFSFYPEERLCNGFEEALSRYRELLPQIRLAGPTSFAPVIEMAMTIVEQSGGQYHVLVVIADGQVTRSVDTAHGQLSQQEQRTVEAIVKASEYPLSIILVGVGDGPWDMMKEFDDNIPARAFDNFQFVNFTEIMSKNMAESRKETEFALTALMEIPTQYKATMELNILGHRSGKSPQRIALPPPVYSSQPSHMSRFKQSSTLYDSSSFNSKAGFQQSAPPYPGPQMSMGTGPPESSSFDHQVCPICLSNPKDMAFGCGHQPFFQHIFNFCFITALLFFSLHHVGFTSAVSRPSKPKRRTPVGHTRTPGVTQEHQELTPQHHELTHDHQEVSGAKMGQWKVLLNSTGVVAMHMTLTHRNTVLIGAVCTSSNVHDSACWAHSVEYDINANKSRALLLQTDTWCSSGAFLSNGTLLQTGGHGNGYRRIRYFKPCANRQRSWIQSSNSLTSNRWYLPIKGFHQTELLWLIFSLPFLHRTYDSGEDGNNLYPFLHLSSDGHLFIFANRDSILLNYRRIKVLKTYPRIPDDGARNYPSSGSSEMLPLSYKDGFQKVEVIVCGGSSRGAYEAARGGRFLKALNSCGRMVISGILIINGARNGAAGWNNAARPSLQTYLYSPKKKWGRKFSVLKATKIPRLYHSSAVLLPDGRILVAGGNPNTNYTFRNVAFPTELRPSGVSINLEHNQDSVRYGEDFTIRYRIVRTPGKVVNFNIYAPPFTTHSMSMNQRMLRLRCKTMIRERIAPSGYYMPTVVNEGIPSIAQWLKLDTI
ncbi:hypothetical protein MKX01_040192 [Papaver californicum]|nr:hypothetical protein MKX01_040192 [Papaver californicum]